MSLPSFDELADLICKQQRLRTGQQIEAATRFEDDLGISGDDGDELLEAVEQKYGVTFTADSFDLQPNESLFHGEGFDGIGFMIRGIFRKPEPEIRTFTVGELHDALIRELNRTQTTES